MKLLNILKEIDLDRLTPAQKQELINQGSLMIDLPSDPNRPTTSGSEVVYLPKMGQIKQKIIQNKREFDVYMFSTDNDIKEIAKEINKLYNKLYTAVNALDKTIGLKQKNRM
jgi:hypothetical protein